MPRGQPGRGRGRGRGGHRGRGRHIHRRPQNAQPQPAAETADIDSCRQKPHLLFTTNASVDIHHDFQEEDCPLYVATLLTLIEVRVDLTAGSKAKGLAAAWARRDHALVDKMLSLSEHFGLVEILKALNVLDAGRKIREWEKRLQHLNMQTDKPKKRKLGKIKSNIDNMKLLKPKVGSLSGALVRHVKKWVQSQPSSDLEFYALHYPKQPWKELADLCHLHPEKDFQLPWFLSFCYDQPAPESSMISQCAIINNENVNELVSVHEIPYSHIKSFSSKLTEENKLRIAKYTDKVDTLLWNYEDLMCPAVDAEITARIEAGEKVGLTYGKLMERLLTLKAKNRPVPCTWNDWGEPDGGVRSDEDPVSFYKLLIPQAEEGLKKINIPLEAPVAVIGDRSPSMGVAIRTSTIIASLMASVTSATLSFFSSVDYIPDKIPVTAEDVLDLATTLKTDGATAPAASLWPYYEGKKIVKTFVMVTDEEENTNSNGYRFTPLFKKYYEEVYPAKLVFVSFLHSQHSRGQMVEELKREGFNPMQFKFDGSRPDLTKLDSMLGMLALETDEYKSEVSRKKEEIILGNLKALTLK